MEAINARVRTLQTLGRAEHFDSEGGGRIVRSIYCEPYTAHKRVATALRGSVKQIDKATDRWARAQPHADPIYPWFYCQDVQVEPAQPAAARAARNMRFNTQNNPADPNQFDAIQTALNTVDDYDAAELLDNLTPAEIAAGGIDNLPNNDTQTLNTGEEIDIGTYYSRGYCGARITATYLPLIFQPGAYDEYKFDFVDPQWEPVTLTTQTGRTLYFWSPMDGGVVPLTSLHGGLTDTYAHPEVVWRFSIRRLMVPFLPSKTIGLLTNKINRLEFQIGDQRFPPGTVRMEAPDVIMRRAPDGNTYWDMTLKFLVRQLYDEFYDDSELHATKGYQRGWVGWNWAYGVPAVNWTDLLTTDRACYYPVCWNGGLFQLFGANHPLFLADNTVAAQMPPGVAQELHTGPFVAGFTRNQ